MLAFSFSLSFISWREAIGGEWGGKGEPQYTIGFFSHLLLFFLANSKACYDVLLGPSMANNFGIFHHPSFAEKPNPELIKLIMLLQQMKTDVCFCNDFSWALINCCAIPP